MPGCCPGQGEKGMALFSVVQPELLGSIAQPAPPECSLAEVPKAGGWLLLLHPVV